MKGRGLWCLTLSRFTWKMVQWLSLIIYEDVHGSQRMNPHDYRDAWPWGCKMHWKDYFYTFMVPTGWIQMISSLSLMKAPADQSFHSWYLLMDWSKHLRYSQTMCRNDFWWSPDFPSSTTETFFVVLSERSQRLLNILPWNSSTDSNVSLGMNCNNFGDHLKWNRFYTSKSAYRFKALLLQEKQGRHHISLKMKNNLGLWGEKQLYQTSVACSPLLEVCRLVALWVMGASSSDKEKECKELKTIWSIWILFFSKLQIMSTPTFLFKPITRLQFSSVQYFCSPWPNTCETTYILTSLRYILPLQNKL